MGLQGSQAIPTTGQPGIPQAINGNIFIDEQVLGGGVAGNGLGIDPIADTVYLDSITGGRLIYSPLYATKNGIGGIQITGVTATEFVSPDVKTLMGWPDAIFVIH